MIYKQYTQHNHYITLLFKSQYFIYVKNVVENRPQSIAIMLLVVYNQVQLIYLRDKSTSTTEASARASLTTVQSCGDKKKTPSATLGRFRPVAALLVDFHWFLCYTAQAP
jgi:hypothetical protein